VRVLLTGATGFLGTHLAATLRAGGHEITPIQRPGPPDPLPHADLVIHLAFPTSRAIRDADPEAARATVARLAAGAAALVAASGATHLILASSGKMYGPPVRLPVDETHPVRPATLLGELKRLEEDVALAAIRAAGGTALTVLRLFNVYGPGQRRGFVIPDLMAAIRAGDVLRPGELSHRRDYVAVADAVRAFQVAAAHPPRPGAPRVANVCSGASTSVADLIELLADLAGRRPEVQVDPARLRPDEPPEERAACPVLAALGWQPRVALAEGLRETWHAAPGAGPGPAAW
jgi:nucleoside-diphosphate-sugar epimerase